MTQYQIEAKIYLFSPKIFFSLMILLPNFFHDLSIPRCISYNTNQTTKIAWQIWCTVLLVSQSIVPRSPFAWLAFKSYPIFSAPPEVIYVYVQCHFLALIGAIGIFISVHSLLHLSTLKHISSSHRMTVFYVHWIIADN